MSVFVQVSGLWQRICWWDLAARCSLVATVAATLARCVAAMSARNLLSRSHLSSTIPTAGSRLAQQLAAEWQQLHLSPAAGAQVGRWGHTVLAGLQQPGDVLDAIDATEDPDEILAALLELHQADDPIAGRVLLQAMLPALMNRAWRCRMPREDDTFDARPQVAVTAFWTVIGRAHPNTKVAEHLTLATVHEMTYWSRRGSAGSWEHDTEIRDDVDETRAQTTAEDRAVGTVDASSDLLELLVWATDSGVLNRDDAQLLTDVYLSGTTTADHDRAAARAGISTQACRKRVTRARQRLTVAVRDYVAEDSGADLQIA